MMKQSMYKLISKIKIRLILIFQKDFTLQIKQINYLQFTLQDSINKFQLIFMPKMGIYLFFLFLIVSANSQTLNINLITPDNATTNMYSNGLYNPTFVQQFPPFQCSINSLYTYSQTPTQKAANTAYTIQFANSSSSYLMTVTTRYGVINPTLSTNYCNNSTCNIYISNNCAQNTGQFNYFDIVLIQISTFPAPFAYNVLCDNTFSTNTFQWGLIILMVFCLMVIIIMAFFSKAWSLGGAGIKINYWLIIIFWAIVAIGGTLAALTTGFMGTVIQVVILIVGIVGVQICASEAIFLLKIKYLQISFKIKNLVKIRILDILSLLIGVAFAIGYYFSNKNWILNDIICVSIIIASIKIMKFTNLKISLFALIVSLAVQMVFVQVIHFTLSTSYNDLILNEYNYPFQIQLPTLNPVYKQRCAWLPFTAIIYPGIFMSYLRRFDINRNTNIYFITAIVSFIIGSVIWVLISLGSVHSWPYELVTGPVMMALVVIFSYKRRQLRTLWDGNFYDQDFADRQGINQIMDVINDQSHYSSGRDSIELVRNSVFSNLKINRRQDSDLTMIKKVSNISRDRDQNQKQQRSFRESSISESKKSQTN